MFIRDKILLITGQEINLEFFPARGTKARIVMRELVTLLEEYGKEKLDRSARYFTDTSVRTKERPSHKRS